LIFGDKSLLLTWWVTFILTIDEYVAPVVLVWASCFHASAWACLSGALNVIGGVCLWFLCVFLLVFMCQH